MSTSTKPPTVRERVAATRAAHNESRCDYWLCARTGGGVAVPMVQCGLAPTHATALHETPEGAFRDNSAWCVP
jgi:hypothetical protein